MLKYVLFHFAAYFDRNSETREEELLRYAKGKNNFDLNLTRCFVTSSRAPSTLADSYCKKPGDEEF